MDGVKEWMYEQMSDIWYWSDYVIVDNQLAHIKSQLF